MCLCSPASRTPYCGKKGCEWPKQERTHDYMQGYNDCVEKIIQLINVAVVEIKSGETSINDTLRLLRQKILDHSFQEIQRQRGVI